MANDLSTPLTGRKRKPGAKRHLPVARILAGILLLLGAAFVARLLLVDDPDGGRPSQEVAITTTRNGNEVANAVTQGPVSITADPQELPADLVYPGDDVVDYIGLDVYDYKQEGSAQERWDRHYLKAPFGLQWHRDFATQHGKLMSYPEWGVGQFGDNPFFIQQMRDWFVQNDDKIAYAAYFDVDGLWPTQIDNNQFPQSQKLFRKLFKR